MATITRYVDPAATGAANGTSWTDAYTSLNQCEAAEQQDLTDGGGDLWEGWCRSSGAHPADNVLVTFDGWGTNSGSYITVNGEGSGTEANYDTTKYRVAQTGSNWNEFIFRVQEPYTRVFDMQIAAANDNNTRCTTMGDNSPVYWVHCVIKGAGGNGSGSANKCMDIYGGYVIDCLIFDSGVGISGTNAWTQAQAPRLYNCTISNCTQGITVGGNPGVTIYLKNLLVDDCGDSYALGAGPTYDADYNVTDRAETTGGAHDQQGQTFTYVNLAGDDFHLDAADAGAQDLGVSLVADGQYPFSDDINGDDRTGGTWDCGCDECVATGGGSIVPLVMSQMNQFAGGVKL